MIHLLVVGGGGPDLSASPIFEILRAGGVGEAIEKLSRNRRIDAVLFFDEALARESARLFAEEDPAGPPLFLAAPAAVPGVTSLDANNLLGALQAHLEEG